MKIAVLVKYVPDATGERRFTPQLRVDRSGAGLLSELDEYAVEQALRLAESGEDVEVVALTMGPPDAAVALKRALQMGVGSAVHVCDDALAGSDALATSAVLAAAVRRCGADLVLCGMASTDAVMGVVPVMIAQRLGWPAATLAASVEVTDRVVRIRRDTDEARLVVEAELPAVVSVTDQSGEARYPSMKGILAAKKKPVEAWDLTALDLHPAEVGAAAALTAVHNVDPRPPKAAGSVVVDNDGSGAAAIVDFLVTGKYI